MDKIIIRKYDIVRLVTMAIIALASVWFTHTFIYDDLYTLRFLSGILVTIVMFRIVQQIVRKLGINDLI